MKAYTLPYIKQITKRNLRYDSGNSKVCLVKAMVFPVVMYGYESWTLKNAECCRTDVFELCCWKILGGSLGLQGDQTS